MHLSIFLLTGVAFSPLAWGSIKLFEPITNYHTTSPSPSFTWTPHPAALARADQPVRYDIEIVSDGAFDSIVDKDTVYLNRYVCDRPFSAGTYYWRVRPVPHEKRPDPWTKAEMFTVVPCEEQLAVCIPPDLHDHADVVQSAVREARRLSGQGKSVKLVFPPGDYHIGESFVGPLIELSDTTNVVVDGTGALIHFPSRKQGLIRANRSRKITIMGFDSSFTKGSLRFQGRVKAVDASNRKVTVSIEPGFPGFDASDDQAHDIFYLLEPDSAGRLKSGVQNFFRANGGCTKEGDNAWSFTLPQEQLDAWNVGDRFCYNFRSGSSHLVDFSESRSMTACGLTNAGWGGMQFVAIEGNDYRILNCTTRFDEGKWMTGNADGVHVRGHKPGPWIEGVKVQAIGDDSVALYARPASMKSVKPGGDSKTAICRREFFNLEPGDGVAFFQPLQGAILLETTVKSVRPVEAGFEVIFAGALPGSLKFDGPVQEVPQIWNRSKSCGDFMVRNSEFINIRRYGTVFRSRRGVVENNTYRGNSARAIVFANETQWPNGLYASEIIVRNNNISDSCFDHPSRPAAIAFLFNGYKKEASTIGPRNILIEGNTVENCPSPEIVLSWVRNAVVRNNRVKSKSGALAPAKTESKDSTGIITFPL